MSTKREEHLLLVRCASSLAGWLHRDQLDKQGRRYIDHLRRVAGLVYRLGGTPEQVAAAWLHDAVEDGHIGTGALGALFPSPLLVTRIVQVLSRQADSESYAGYIERILAEGNCSRDARLAFLVKLCDLHDNLLRTAPELSSLADRYRKAWPKIVCAMEEHGIAVDLELPGGAS